ncbi:DUF202 domain-containing protein [Pseudonocardia acaciae]|uniref:DUF202 domain-containing protein n=1 Tax=Pseudonocardia acaciae TaxID=551276 RepID=UPI00048FE9F3|nr:DUF202 domain-containing protein [Pseudonocardia acaciae]
MTPRRDATDGLQPERTALAWSRTSLGSLTGGALLLLRHIEHYHGPLRLLPAVMALVIAAAAYAIGQRRLTALRSRPLPSSRSIRRQVLALGWAVIALTVVTSVVLGVS